ncbi:RAB31 isoform 4 [Pan troglodytes]|uniref:RAB31 isoform 4 n=1 Tax=Pan troglodytes TaxID=9598 RepID=A0A2J8J0H6_PANTR|nr:RAB31 isoform 4 [Pan troglodytes]
MMAIRELKVCLLGGLMEPICSLTKCHSIGRTLDKDKEGCVPVAPPGGRWRYVLRTPATG